MAELSPDEVMVALISGIIALVTTVSWIRAVILPSR